MSMNLSACRGSTMLTNHGTGSPLLASVADNCLPSAWLLKAGGVREHCYPKRVVYGRTAMGYGCM